jgi:hypothetical protein
VNNVGDYKMVLEQTTAGTYSISDQLPTIYVQITIHIEISEDPNGEFEGIGISMDPSLIPEDLHEYLFFQRISNGVHLGIADAGVPLPQNGMDVTITMLDVSVPLSTINSEEDIRTLGEKIEGLVRNSVTHLLTTAQQK